MGGKHESGLMRNADRNACAGMQTGVDLHKGRRGNTSCTEGGGGRNKCGNKANKYTREIRIRVARSGEEGSERAGAHARVDLHKAEEGTEAGPRAAGAGASGQKKN